MDVKFGFLSAPVQAAKSVARRAAVSSEKAVGDAFIKGEPATLAVGARKITPVSQKLAKGTHPEDGTLITNGST